VRTARRALVALGTVAMGYAALGALRDADVDLFGVLLFLAGVLVLHDAVLLPAAIGAGALIGRFLPEAARPVTRTAAIITLTVAVVALPLVLGFGRAADDPSVLPLPYGRGLLEILGLVWASAAVIAGLRILRHRRAAGEWGRGARVDRAP
jgi:ABC-type sulfate transport system permease subunit